MNFIQDIRDGYIGFRPKMAKAISQLKKKEFDRVHTTQPLTALDGLMVDAHEARMFQCKKTLMKFYHIPEWKKNPVYKAVRDMYLFVFKPHIFYSEYKTFVQVQGDIASDISRNCNIALRKALSYRLTKNKNFVNNLYLSERVRIEKQKEWEKQAKTEYRQEVLSDCTKDTKTPPSAGKTDGESLSVDTNTSINSVGNINIQRMVGSDKQIENYEKMVGNLFEGQTKTSQKVATHIGGMPVINNQNIRK